MRFPAYKKLFLFIFFKQMKIKITPKKIIVSSINSIISIVKSRLIESKTVLLLKILY